MPGLLKAPFLSHLPSLFELIPLTMSSSPLLWMPFPCWWLTCFMSKSQPGSKLQTPCLLDATFYLLSGISNLTCPKGRPTLHHHPFHIGTWHSVEALLSQSIPNLITFTISTTKALVQASVSLTWISSIVIWGIMMYQHRCINCKKWTTLGVGGDGYW